MSKELLKYENIKDKLKRDGFLFNHPYGISTEVIQNINLEPELENKLFNNCYCSGRIQSHLIRLLQRSDVERNFALFYIQSVKTNLFDNLPKEKILHVLSSEGSDTQMFWTFAPYLFDSCVNKNICNKNALEKILNWSSDGNPESDRINLKGLDFLNEHKSNKYVLSGNLNDISHLFTAQEADQIVDLCFK